MCILLGGNFTFKGFSHFLPDELCGRLCSHCLGGISFLLLSHQVLWLPVEVVFRLMLLASVAFVPPTEVVVLAAAANPTTIREVELRFLGRFFLALRCGSLGSGCGFFEIVYHNLVDLHCWKLRNRPK